jgi:hypothetical protein
MRWADEAELQKRLAECREAAELARHATGTSPDPAWEGPCAGLTPLELDRLRAQAEEVLRHAGRWFSFLSGAFRRAKRRLSRVRPDAEPEMLLPLAESLLRHLDARQLHERLALLNHRLLPEHAPPPDAIAQRAFPRLAEETLLRAAWLIRLERVHAWCSAVLDEFLQSGDRVGPVEASLRQHVEAKAARRQLEQTSQALIPGFPLTLDPKMQVKFPAAALKSLGQAGWVVRFERSSPWVGPLLDAFTRHKGTEPVPAVQAIRSYLDGLRLRAELAQVNRGLVPGHNPAAVETGSVGYPKGAADALHQAAALCRLRVQHSWVSPLLQELTGAAGQNGPFLRALRSYLEALDLRDRLAEVNQCLIPGLRPPADVTAQVRFAREAWQGLQEADQLCGLARSHPWVDPLVDALVAADGPRLTMKLGELDATLHRGSLVKGMLDTLSSLNGYLQGEGLREPYQLVKAGKSVLPWADRLEKGLGGLQALVHLELDRQERIGPAGEALNALEEYERGRASGARLPAPDSPLDADHYGSLDADHYGDWWSALVVWTATAVWQARCREECPDLVRLTPEVHREQVGQLESLLTRKRELEAGAIRERWLIKQQQFRNQPWNQMFQERNSKNGTAKRLREAVELSWDVGLPAMRPCWLVNPSAASQLFPLDPGLFDLVIFDEASQCPVEEAIPVIYRGKRLVVSGDENQLPPTTFFSAGAEIEAEEIDPEEAEANENPAGVLRRRQHRAAAEALMEAGDLLEVAINKLTQLYLCVHYRSDHPALIDVSNRAFYGGQLEAPPAQRISLEGKRPIQYHAVGGRYLDRTNVAEAQRVVALIGKLWTENPTSPTLGVVTFNQAQRDLIEGFLDQECLRDESFAARYRVEVERREANQDVGFFVKNLENVQGDERDIMIVSTTFGLDSQGRFYKRFGPVGAKGGHRRLNVAVTRARQQVIIVESMPLEQIAGALASSTTTSPTPSGYLQLYLAYAKAVSEGDDRGRRVILDRLGLSANPARRLNDAEPLLEADLTAEIKRLGYAVERGIGEAGFWIDLGVLHPDPKRGYILGIDCDGGPWYGDRSARTREVWRRGVLQRRGWSLYQVWGNRWWSNRDEEVRLLRVALAEAEGLHADAWSRGEKMKA